ncbi:MAG TPA: hypothetical protein VGJ90_00880 [Methylophilaceae bacterium]
MLRRLFNLFGAANTTTIALATDGIAICESGKTPKLLASANTRYESRAETINALKSVAGKINAKQVRFMISNHFVRYGVLPWQEGIVARQDWLALAQHDFRKRFGAVADQWQVRVSLSGYGKSVAISAIDQALLDDLQALAQTQQWQIASIEPLLVSILNSKLSSKSDTAQNAWLVIAEPERVLLCETNQQEWQRFTQLSPPSGLEAEQATQQILRSTQAITPLDTKLTQNKHREVVAFVAPSLVNPAQKWISDIVNLRLAKTASNHSHQTNSALWMAGL